MESSKSGIDDDGKSTSETKDEVHSFSSSNSNPVQPWKVLYWSFVASLSFLCTGLLRAYTSPALLSIQNEREDDRLTTDILLSTSSIFPAFSGMGRKDLISWIASIPPLASFIGTILSGPCLDQLGRRNTLFLLTVPATIGWILVSCAESIPVLLMGRALTGLASGVATASAPLYISEICMSMSTSGDNNKASRRSQSWLGLLPGVMLSTGIFLGFILAHLCQPNLGISSMPSWRRLAEVMTLFPVILFVLLYTIPESPLWLQEKMKQKKERDNQKAEKSSHFDLEMEEVVPSPRQQRSQNEKKMNLSEKSELIPRSASAKLLSHHLILVCVLMILQQFSGGNVLIYYLSEILVKTPTSNSTSGSVPVSASSPSTNEMVHQASLVVGLVQFLGFFLAFPLIDHPKIGRKTLLVTSSLLMSVSHLLLGFHFHHHHHSNYSYSSDSGNFIPLRVILLCCILSSYSIGLGPIPFQFIEIFPSSTSSIVKRKKATSYISSVASLINHLALFAVVKAFPYMFHMDEQEDNDSTFADEHYYFNNHYHGPDVTFWIFSAVCFAATLFSLIFVPGANHLHHHNQDKEKSSSSLTKTSNNDPG